MLEPGQKRPPRQPLSPEEVLELIRIKRYRQKLATDRFKKSNLFKILNVFNVFCIIIYSELIFSFMGQCNYKTDYMTHIKVYYGEKVKAGKKIFSSAIINTATNGTYEISVQDTSNYIAKHLVDSKTVYPFYIGKDWLLQKEIKIQLEESSITFLIKRSSPLLFVSVLLGIVTFVLFGYNLNEVRYSLRVISFINAINLLYFIFL